MQSDVNTLCYMLESGWHIVRYTHCFAVADTLVIMGYQFNVV